MSTSVPIAMVDASTSVSTLEAPTGVNATVATIYRLTKRAVQPLHPVRQYQPCGHKLVL